MSSTCALDQALLLATDFSNTCEHTFGSALEEMRLKAYVSRTWGDCYGHVLVATGRADVMLDPVMNIWDCAALLPILEEAGGTFTDFVVLHDDGRLELAWPADDFRWQRNFHKRRALPGSNRNDPPN